ncbi:RHS repeat-associated core domain-containing protein [Promicromonospora sp. NPDC019610]|uniref:RHS repeat-associated core domain-containing protein n=1 Tax=Promicromonospora sp. NPDC019610 TaxID=3364405 RepID=UPI00378CEEF1
MESTTYAYDPLDRTASKTAGGETTDYTYLGLSSEVLGEEVAGELTKSYQYSPWGQRLSQITHQADPEAGVEAGESAYYGYNAHTDVETLTDDAGDAVATYGYSAYGNADEAEYTGFDKPEAGAPEDAEPYNAYRYNSKRWDAASGTYDMGFRDYAPGLNRFTTRDMYNGALSDMGLGTSPYTSNRYAFGAGNPISMIEIDGHLPCAEGIREVCASSSGSGMLALLAPSPPIQTLTQQPSNFFVDPKSVKAPGNRPPAVSPHGRIGGPLLALTMVLSLSGDTAQYRDKKWEPDLDQASAACSKATGNTFHYNPLDAEGRATGVLACLNTIGRLDNRRPVAPVGLQAPWDDKTHLLARELGGISRDTGFVKGRQNIVPMHWAANQDAGTGMVAFEAKAKQAIKSGNVLYASIPVYRRGQLRPVGVNMTLISPAMTCNMYVANVSNPQIEPVCS